MTNERRSPLTSTDWLIAVGVALAGALAMWLSLTPTHGWGDDFAGYLMQAHAMEHGTMREELSLSTHLLSLSDSKFGPPAYPWGYPAMLWLASHAVGWDIYGLKFVGVVSNALLAFCMYCVGRRYVSPAASVLVAVFAALQPSLLFTGDSLTSDTLGLALNALALLGVEALAAPPPATGDRPRTGVVLVAALLAAAAFSVRSNGAFMAAAMFSALAWPLVFDATRRKATLVVEMTMLTVVTSLLFVAYLRLLPDGSLAHAGYLSLAPSQLVRRLVETISTMADFVPFSLLRAVGLFNPVTVLIAGALGLAVCAIGAWRHRAHASGLVVFAILNFALLLTFPDNGGPRYLFPLLLPVGVLFAAGVQELAQYQLPRLEISRDAARTALVNRAAFLASTLVMAVGVTVAFRGVDRRPVGGPLTPVAESLFTFVKGNVPADAPVSFFKPRALRMFTERQGIAVTLPENLARAAFVVIDKREEDGKWEKTWQVSRDRVEAFDGGRFTAKYENSQFVVYGARVP